MLHDLRPNSHSKDFVLIKVNRNDEMMRVFLYKYFEINVCMGKYVKLTMYAL